MACSGLNIPCEEGSSIYVFDAIFTDIGDDQSILNSLSTFSSHMLHIIEIIKHATSNSLILVDELGFGTDPLEGSHLAISILEHLKTMGCLIVATTHYQELKQYALLTDGFENASVEFDLATLSPTYRLLIGVPGKSNAFEISRKLGLDESILITAQNRMTSHEIDIENLLKTIYDDKILIEKQKNQISQELEQVATLRKSLEKETEAVKQQEQDSIHRAKLEARNILLEAKEEVTNRIQEMNTITTSKDLENIRNHLNKKIKNITLTESVPINNLETSLKAEEIKPNMQVFVTNLKQNGTVLSPVSKSNDVLVQVGNLKVNVALKNIRISDAIEKNSISFTNQHANNASFSKTKTIKTEINVIGLNVEEAIFVVDKFLDDASLSKLQTVRIIHGKGTGKLRNRYPFLFKKTSSC